MKTIYYKVVANNRTKKEGVYHSARYGGFVEYKLNEWAVSPDNSRLFVFDDLDDAKRFARDWEYIFECEIVGGIKGYGADNSYDMEQFWKLFNSFCNKKKKVDFKSIFKEIVPTWYPAILAKKVKLIKKIK